MTETAATDIAAMHRRALESTRGYVIGIGTGQWTMPTPCEGWAVRDLLNHIVAGNLWAAELARGRTIADVGSSLDGDVVGPDAVASYDTSAEAAAAAFEAPGALEAPAQCRTAPSPARSTPGIASSMC